MQPTVPTSRVLRAATALGLLVFAGAAWAGPPSVTTPSPKPEPLVVRVDDGGFRWVDAAIGATAGFGIALVLAGALVLGGRREPSGSHLDPKKERP